MPFNSKKGIYIAQRSELNGNCSNQANLLMIVNGENKHSMAIKNLPRPHKVLNAIYSRVYHFCMNCLNGFCTAPAREKPFEY